MQEPLLIGIFLTNYKSKKYVIYLQYLDKLRIYSDEFLSFQISNRLF